jgi:hypothetical protein
MSWKGSGRGLVTGDIYGAEKTFQKLSDEI